MENQFWIMLAWVAAASVLGFVISAVFAGWLQLARHRFLAPYVLLTLAFLYGFFTWNRIDLIALLIDNWIWGVGLGVLVSLFLIRTVRSQPISRETEGTGLIFDLAWSGVVYGLIDALFLNVMPVVAIWVGGSQFAWANTLLGKVGLGFAGLLASLLVTLCYHLGYPEFRNPRVGLVLVGNSLITLAYLLSGNPLGSIISHTAMHIAAVLQGPETTIQLPPHYQLQIDLH